MEIHINISLTLYLENKKITVIRKYQKAFGFEL